jgi:methylglutaconyl-CoA hydratase
MSTTPTDTTATPGLDIERAGGVARLWLNRPEVRNALDPPLIQALTHAFVELGRDPAVRVIVIGGRGGAFCAGGDLGWMRELGTRPQYENVGDALRLAGLFRALYDCPRPTIARVHGACFGGALGLVAACDIAFAASDARFCLSEVRLGLIPATIGPHVVRAIGARAASRYMLTAEVFDGAQAARLGLVHEAVPDVGLDAAIASCVSALLAGGPQAQSAIKRLIRHVDGRPLDDALLRDTAQRIADARASAEGQDGLAAAIAKRKPAWAAPPDGTSPPDGAPP